MPQLSQFDYIFAIGTFFAFLDAFNNGANDVANAWATSVSSRSISYRWAMVLATIFEILGATTVGARTAETIKNGIIPNSAFQGNAGVQMLAFTCALAGASIWVMWCTKHSAHVSSTYSLISAVAGVGVATVGASKVQWGWNGGKGLGAIFSGLIMAPTIAGSFGAIIFGLIKYVVHVRKNPVPWAVYTVPLWFLIAATVCTLSVVYKGSPNLGLNKKPAWYIASVTLGTGFGVAVLSAIFFVPYIHAKVIKKDYTVRPWMILYGPALWSRPAPADATHAAVPNYAVVQDDDLPTTTPAPEAQTSSSESLDYEGKETRTRSAAVKGSEDNEKSLAMVDAPEKTQEQLQAEADAKVNEKLCQSKSPIGWALRFLRDNPMGRGRIYEFHNLAMAAKRLPAQITVGLLYGMHYDIHAAQAGIKGTVEGDRMARVYSHAIQYPNEVEHSYSFVQVLTACTASFAHGANDIGNAVGPWAVIYRAWSTGSAQASKATVDTWQLAVVAIVLCIGFITYGYKIMRVMGSKLTWHSPSRGCSMEMGAAITVLVFSQFSLPVSTSMCITGATVGVGLMNGTWRAVNWQRVGLLVFSWIMTIPIAGTLAGVIMGIVLNAPHF
ncbi:putative sodium/phosphate symporter [Elsinoe ampelina]|uniref:Phosphate transporter n=1 Tax=Elsinoe ampelina TaxID=302913 RepID=A0A6A6GI12_9PEZI|nr:putative sodium/phosphate symporter [Elsinoe ampelina]